jgi:hypothetical protein
LKAKKTSREKKIVTAIIIVAVLLGAYQLYAVSRQGAPSSTSSSSASTYVPLQPSDFSMSYTTGCLYTDPSRAYLLEYFSVTVRNSLNESVHYINVTIRIPKAYFTNGTAISASWSNYTAPPVLEAGESNTAILQFGIHIPISSPKYGKYQVKLAELSITAYIEQNGFPVPIPLQPTIIASDIAPACLVAPP